MAINPLPNTTQSTTGSAQTSGVSGSTNTTPSGTDTAEILRQLELEYRSTSLISGSDNSARLERLRQLLLGGANPSTSGPTGEPAPSDPRLNGLYEAARIAENIGAEMDTFSAAAIAGYSQGLPSFEDLAGDKDQFEEYQRKANEALAAANQNLTLILPDSPLREQAEAYLARVQAVVDRIQETGSQTYDAAVGALGQVKATPVEVRDGKSFLVPVNGRVVIEGDDARQDLRFRMDGDKIYFDRDGQRFWIDTSETKDIILNLKGGDDKVQAWEIDIPGVNFVINAGAGQDYIQGTRGGDWIIGGAGYDRIFTEGAREGEDGEVGEYDIVDVRDGGEDFVYNGGTGGWSRYAGTTEVLADELDKVNEGDYREVNPRREKTTVNGVQQEPIPKPPSHHDD